MWTRGGLVMPTLVVVVVVLLPVLEYRVEGRAVPYHRRRGPAVTRLHNVTLSNSTLYPAKAAGADLVLEGYRFDHFGQELFALLEHTARLTLRKGRTASMLFCSATLDTLEVHMMGLQDFEVDPVPSPRLRVLQITHNSLLRISPTVAYLVALQYIDLSKNRLTYVHLDVFEPMRDLRALDVSENRIVRIGAGSTEPGGQPLTVRNLLVSYNQLEAFEGFPDLFPSLKIVNLNGNPWVCRWVDWARGEIMRHGITVFGVDYDCPDRRSGGLCCYDDSATSQEVVGNTTESWQVANATDGTVEVRYGTVQLYFPRTSEIKVKK